MNKTEARYAGDLEILRLAGEVLDWRFEPIRLRLADRTTYTPDFAVVFADGTLRFDEVKGHWEEDARVKFKVAAEQYSWFRFMAVKVAKDGGWDEEVMR